MSVNSDEIAEGILKAVGQLAVIAGVIYCIYSYPWLLWLLSPFVVVWLAWAAWSALKGVLARSPNTSHKIGLLLLWSGSAALLIGGCAYYFGVRDLSGWLLFGGFFGVVIGAVMKDQAEQRELKRCGPTRDLLEEFKEILGPDPEEQERHRRDAIQRAQDAMAKILDPPKPKK